MLIKETNITINVKDIERSIAFYESIGFQIKTRYGNHYAQVTAPGVIIGLHPASDNNLHGTSGNLSIGFSTDNFADAKSLLASLSLQVNERSEEGGQFLHFNDPDGTSLYFIKPKW